MSTPDPTDDLQFQTVEPSSPVAAAVPAQTCVVCKRPIQSIYYAVRDRIVCPNCAAMINAGPPGSGLVRFMKAAVFGTGAAIPGAVLWGAILYYTHYQIGYVALLVGFMVGKAIRKGSGGRGGIGYQFLAVVLTYCAAAAAYIPSNYEYFSQHAEASVAAVETFVESVIDPIYKGAHGGFGLLILGIGLWEAWKFTRYTPIPLTGPYQLTPKSPPISLAAPPPDPGVIL